MKIKRDAPAGAPEWVLTYGDMMSLLLCFFILLASLSEVRRDDKFEKAAKSIRLAFGFRTMSGDSFAPMPLSSPLIAQLRGLTVPQEKGLQGESDRQGIEGREYRVTDIREGIHVEFGGRISFDRFSAVLKPAGAELVRQAAEKLKGKNNILKITGHATREPLPEDALFSEPMDLSYARARAVANEMVRAGIDGQRIRIVAAGSAAPLRKDDFDEERRAINRRVEVVITEALVEDFEGAAD